MSEIEVKTTAGTKTANFLEKNKKGLTVCLCAVIIALVAYIAFTAVASSSKAKNLQKIDEISYALTNGSSSLSDDELNERRNKAIEDLDLYLKKGGIVGVRANLLAAEIAYQKDEKMEAANYWNAAANADKKAYTAPLAWLNMGAAYEDLNQFDDAAASYKKAWEAKDFILRAHAGFSYGRVLEGQEKYEDAKAAYEALNDQLPDDSFAKLAKTRLIQLKIDGKIE